MKTLLQLFLTSVYHNRIFPNISNPRNSNKSPPRCKNIYHHRTCFKFFKPFFPLLYPYTFSILPLLLISIRQIWIFKRGFQWWPVLHSQLKNWVPLGDRMEDSVLQLQFGGSFLVVLLVGLINLLNFS